MYKNAIPVRHDTIMTGYINVRLNAGGLLDYCLPHDTYKVKSKQNESSIAGFGVPESYKSRRNSLCQNTCKYLWRSMMVVTLRDISLGPVFGLLTHKSRQTNSHFENNTILTMAADNNKKLYHKQSRSAIHRTVFPVEYDSRTVHRRL